MEPRIEPPTDEDIASFDSEEPTEVMPERPPMSTPGEPPVPAPADSARAASAAAASAPAAKPARPAPPAKPAPAAPSSTSEESASEESAESKDRAYVAPRVIPRAAVPEAPSAQPRIMLNVAPAAPTAGADDAKVREQRRRRAPTLKIERGTLAARAEADAIATLPEGIPAPMPPPAFVGLETKPLVPTDATEASLDVDVELETSPARPSRAPWIVAAVALVAALGALIVVLGPRLSSGPATEAREARPSDAPTPAARPIETSIAEVAPPAPSPTAEPEAVEQPSSEPNPEASGQAMAAPNPTPAELAPTASTSPAATSPAAPRPVAPTSTYRPSRPPPTSKKSDVPREI